MPLPWIVSNVVLASLVALAAWFVQRRLRWYAVARVLWVLVLVKLVTPPIWSVPLGASSSQMACALGTCGCEQHALLPPVVRAGLPWLLLAVWLAGAGAAGWIAWRRWGRFRRLLAHATAAPAEWQALVARLCAELRVRRPPEILALPGRLPPLVVAGWRRPRLVVPLHLLDRLSAAQRRALVMHELTHIKRGDHLVRVLELAVGVIYWWLPGVGALGRQLRACEETCCDAAVVAALPQVRRAYAELLLDVVEFVDPLPGAAAAQITAMSAARDLEQRLRAILEPGKRRRPAWPAAWLAVGLAVAILPCQLDYDWSGRSLRPPSAAGTPDAAQPADSTSGVQTYRSLEISAFCCSS